MSSFQSYCQFPGNEPVAMGDGFVAGLVSHNGDELDGSISVIFFTTDGIQSELVLEEKVPVDDHSNPNIVGLGNSQFLIAYTNHDYDRSIRVVNVIFEGTEFRVQSKNMVQLDSPSTYVYLALVSNDSVLMITRSSDWKPTAFWWDFQKKEASKSFILFPFQYSQGSNMSSLRDGGRPYLLLRNTEDRTYFAINDDHPRSYRSGIYAGYLTESGVFDLDGEKCAELDGRPWSPSRRLTCLYPPGQNDIPWIWDIRIYDNVVKVAYSVSNRPQEQFNVSRDVPAVESNYKTTEYEAGVIRTRTIAPSGSSVCELEGDYYGGISLDPKDKEVTVFSSDVHPLHGRSLSHKKNSLFRSRTRGICIEFREIWDGERGSSIRPRYSGSGPSSHSLIFLTGEYQYFTNFETKFRYFIYEFEKNCFYVSGFGHIDLEFYLTNDDVLPIDVKVGLQALLSKSQKYFEWGSGYSTQLAVDSECPKIVSVDNNLDLVNVLRSKTGPMRNGVNIIGVLEGQIVPKDWGFWDNSRDLASQALEYISPFSQNRDSDLVLIDGRFRMLCFFRVIEESRRDTVIIWDDYQERPHYHLVEKYLPVSHFVGRAAVFRLHQNIIVNEGDYMMALRDPR